MFQARLVAGGLSVGGSYGPHAGRLLRLGHMGEQAHVALVDEAVAVLRDALADLRAAPPSL